MKVLHRKAADFATSAWSGGTTTQLLIWPENGDYGRREFQVRISSAVVELEESDFTPLDGVLRYITPLAGGFTLTHPGKAPVVMAPLDAPYRFSGGESTHCVGRAADLNLMLKGVDGEMVRSSGATAIRPGLNAFFAPGARCYQLGGQTLAMEAGELLVVFAEVADTIDLGEEISFACYACVD